MSITIYGKDSLSVTVTVTDEATDAAKNLTGASVEAVADTGSGSTAIAATATVENAAQGKILVEFAAADFLGSPGNYTCHVRATISGDTQTVAAYDFTVERSIVAA